MSHKKKTWAEKLADAKANKPEAHTFYCEKSIPQESVSRRRPDKSDVTKER